MVRHGIMGRDNGSSAMSTKFSRNIKSCLSVSLLVSHTQSSGGKKPVMCLKGEVVLKWGDYFYCTSRALRQQS